MKAAVYRSFGPPEVLAIEEVRAPEPRPHEVLVKVRATTVTSAEAAMRRGEPLWGRVILGLLRPRKRMRTLGIELAGEIAAIGRDVTRFRIGDEVFGFAGFAIGANAEYMCLPERASLSRKPTGKSFEESAAAVDGASTALYFLRDKAAVERGQRVLVIGASGSIGTYAVQLARMFGADVTAVCSAANTGLVASLGAHQVVDYTKEDFTQLGEHWDVVFDTVGKSSFARCKHTLTRRGCYVPTTGLLNFARAGWTRLLRGRRVIAGMSVEKTAALEFLRPLFESNELRIVIDRRYALDDIVEAHRHVDSGRKRGNVVVTVPHAE
ncbi:MAG TPA: NAD(P)-dependent alcohol dehydrogenase [Nannocystaceae bacterium]|nr:NAD(P)-dependent alcohol dehydrogenase [Nannocystaceae bacterium]